MPEGGLMTGRIGILSWNLHGFVGTDGKRNPDRICDIIREIGPDIAAFQEVDCIGDDSTCRLTADSLRDSVGEHGEYAWAIASPGRRYGQVLASRHPITEADIHDLSVDGREPRRAIEATLEIGRSRTLRVIATHLGLGLWERREQQARLRAIINNAPSEPLVVLGDFNNWLMERRATGLAGVMPERTTNRTFPSRFPFLPLDRIWLKPVGMLAGSCALRRYRKASDHLPLFAEIDVPDALADAAPPVMQSGDAAIRSEVSA
jgi:endonuclease/exonuclease/phosphatase family metal-dependent hydrolase